MYFKYYCYYFVIPILSQIKNKRFIFSGGWYQGYQEVTLEIVQTIFFLTFENYYFLYERTMHFFK